LDLLDHIFGLVSSDTELVSQAEVVKRARTLQVQGGDCHAYG
jgi:hypothetical protein